MKKIAIIIVWALIAVSTVSLTSCGILFGSGGGHRHTGSGSPM